MRSRVSTAVVVALSMVLAMAPGVTAQEVLRFSISNITDFHGRWQGIEDQKNPIPGAERLKCAVDQFAEGKPAHIFTSSGDNIGASPFDSMLLDDAPTIDTLNQMGVKVSSVGNHEFDEGWADLRDRVMPDAQFTYLGANVQGAEGLAPYSIQDLGGVKVAFIGAVAEETANLVDPSGIAGLSFTDPVAATNKVADELTASGEADVVVSLMHEGGLNADRFSKNIDLVFLGHTHEYVNNVAAQPDSRPVVLQAGEYSKGLANVDIAYDKATDTVTFDSVKLLKASELMNCNTKYPEIDATVQAALAESKVEGDKVVGSLPEALNRGSDEGAESGSNRGTESRLNNFIAEVTRWGVERNSNVTPDIGVMNAGGLRADLPAGEITYRQAFSVQPFGNENTYVELKGKDFKDALEQQYKGEGQGRPVLSLGVSDGVSYTYDPQAEKGNKITSVTINGEPLDPEKTYIVAGSKFLLSGGDGFEAFTRGTQPANLGYVDINALLEYLAAAQNDGKPVKARTSQSNVGVHIPAPLKAGEEATIELTSLMYTDNDPVKTVTVELGDAKVTTDVVRDFGRKQYNDAGKATVKLAVPAGLTGTQQLKITTDAGTEVSLPVEISGGDKPAPKPGDEKSSPGSSSSSLPPFVQNALNALKAFFKPLFDLLSRIFKF